MDIINHTPVAADPVTVKALVAENPTRISAAIPGTMGRCGILTAEVTSSLSCTQALPVFWQNSIYSTY